jgi:hypothetical protein
MIEQNAICGTIYTSINTQQATSTTIPQCYSKSCMTFDLFVESPCDFI